MPLLSMSSGSGNRPAMRPYEHLPHRYPFFMLDTAIIIEEGSIARGTRQITINDPLILPDGSLPQVYVIESMAQISGIAGGRTRGSLFAAISNLNMFGVVRAGDTLEVESTVERRIGSICIFNAMATAAGGIIARGDIVLRFDAE